VVDQAIDGGDGHRRVGEDLVPFAEGLVGGHQERSALVAGGDELEEDAGLGLVLPRVAEVVEDQEVVLVELGDGGLACVSLLPTPPSESDVSSPDETWTSSRRATCRRWTRSVVRVKSTR